MRVIDPFAGYKILIGSYIFHIVFALGNMWAKFGVLKMFSNRLVDTG